VADDLAYGSTSIAQPLWLGPGYYTSTEIDNLPSMSSIVVPPGYRARLCTTSVCAYFTSTVRILSSTWNNHIVNIEVQPWVIGAVNVGYGGTSELFGVGTRNAPFQVIGDNTMSSVFAPTTRAVTVCDRVDADGTLVGCSSLLTGGTPPVGFKLPPGVDNAVSYVSVVPRVVTYNDLFTGDSRALAPGTYKFSTGENWLPALRSLAINGLDVKACSTEGTFGQGGGTCRTYTQSVDLAAAGHTGLHYLKVTTPPVIGP
jgi:hypothetical protein